MATQSAKDIIGGFGKGSKAASIIGGSGRGRGKSNPLPKAGLKKLRKKVSLKHLRAD